MKSHAELQQDRITIDLARRRLVGSASEQARAIAKHYVRHAMLAQTLARLLEAQCLRCAHPDAESLIQSMVNQIKRDHLHDFGIALEWETPT